MKKRTKIIGAIALLATLSLGVVVGCTQDDKAQSAGNSVKDQQTNVAKSLERQNKSQPGRVYDYSEIKSVMQNVQDIQAGGAASTTAFYLEGVGMIGWCPSKGVSVSDGWQLTPSRQWVDMPGDKTREWKEIDQAEATGVYPTGTSSGTYTLCVDDNGKEFLKYWEGYVDTTVGVIDTYPADKRIKVEELTYEFKDQKEGD